MSDIKTNIVFGLSKYSCIRINKNILRISSLFFYENQKLRPHEGPFVYISDFFECVKVKFFRFISKQILNSVSLNTIVLELINISLELVVYFSMKIKNYDHTRDPLYIFQIFSKVSKLNFFALYQNKYRPYLVSLNTLVIRINKNILEIISLFFYKN